MRILVVTASKHGSTRGIGDLVADELRAVGHQVATAGADEPLDLNDVGAAVVGSAVYGARVLTAGRDAAERLARELDGPLWVFAVGIKSVSKDPLRASVTAPTTEGYRGGRYPVFGGAIDSAGLSLAEGALIGALGAHDRDLRDSGAVTAWARSIALQLEPAGQGSSSTLPVV
jgi:menaquinone-dependent protoporphyrinogen oxidase